LETATGGLSVTTTFFLFFSTLISSVALPNPCLPSDRIEALVEMGMGGVGMGAMYGSLACSASEEFSSSRFHGEDSGQRNLDI